MIADKLVTIRKENTFEYGWALFTPWHDFPQRNKHYNAIGVSEIVKQITFSKTVTLLLAEPCLSRKIIDELKWVQPYAEITLLAKSNEVADFYKELGFSSVKIEPSLSLNYIGIESKDGKFAYFISDGFQRTDETIESLFSSSKDGAFDFSPFADADKLIVLVDDAPYLSQLFEYCEKSRISSFYAKSVDAFDRSDYDAYKNRTIGLLVAEHVGTGVCIQKNGKLFRASLVNGQFVLVEIETISKWIVGDIYCNLKAKAILKGNEIPQNAYVLYQGEVRPLALKEWHIVEKNVPIDTMADFVAEQFDQSDTEDHNEFSAIAKCVEYRFTLIPPHLPAQSTFSSVYDKAQELLVQWNACCTIPIQKVLGELERFQGNQDFLAMLQHIEDSDISVKNIIGGYHYQDYRFVFQTCKNSLVQDRDKLIDSCCALNAPILDEIKSTQTSGIDDEIRGYEKTIQEKEACIEQNIDVLQSKRRIEILKRKIKELQKVKERLAPVQTSNTANNQQVFIAYCKQLLNGIVVEIHEDSVSSIVHGREQSKQELLNEFLQTWLKPIKDLIDKLVDLLVKMETIDVLESHIVYDYADKRYIVIENENEYWQTLQIQEKYHLQCVVRR